LLESKSDCVDALRGLAAIALEEENDEEALRIHERLLNLGERDAEILYNAGLLSQKLGRLEDAARLYRESLDQRSTFAEALLNLGHTLAAQGKESESRDHWIRALHLKPELATGYFLSE
jgi:tetratricopeptide (TPR) repeat protein